MRRSSLPASGCLILLAALTAFGETKSLGHVTDPLNVPLFGRAGQARVSVELGQMSEGVHAQGGVAVTSRLALVAAGSYAQLNNCMSCTISERRHTELGLAAYERAASGWVREGLAGVGTGRFKASGPHSKWDPQSEDLRVTGGVYNMAFLQANIGRQFRFTDRAASLRLSAWKFDRFSRQDGNGLDLPVARSHLSVYLEPGFIYRLGYKDLKAEAQLGFCLPLLEDSDLDNNRIWFSLGIGLDLFNG